MIQINLLPDEFRRSQRTSAATLSVILIATFFGFGSLSVTGYLYLNVRAEAHSRVSILKEQLDNMTPQVRYAESLDSEKGEFEKRNKTIQEIAKSRTLWSEKLDRFAEIVNRDVMSPRHQVWFDGIDIECGLEAKDPHMDLDGFSAGEEFKLVSNFHEDLSRDAVFAKGFTEFTAPTQTLQDPEEGIDPPHKVAFDFGIKLPYEDPKKKKKAEAAKKAEATESAAGSSN